MRSKLYALALIMTLCSCGLKKVVSTSAKYPATTGTIEVVETGSKIPDGAFRIGSVTVGESGMALTKNCSYEACIEACMQEARKAGAELVYIRKVVEPTLGLGSTCYTVTVDFYRFK